MTRQPESDSVELQEFIRTSHRTQSRLEKKKEKKGKLSALGLSAAQMESKAEISRSLQTDCGVIRSGLRAEEEEEEGGDSGAVVAQFE